MKKSLLICALSLLCCFSLQGQTSVHGRVVVHPENRFLMYEDGTPFFWLGDTAWQMFHRHTVESARIFMVDRAMKGFNVLQGVCLAEHGGLTSPNANGDWAFLDEEFTKPNDKYFDHIEALVDMADSLGLQIGLLPTWGDKINLNGGRAPVSSIPRRKPKTMENMSESVSVRKRTSSGFWAGTGRPTDARISSGPWPGALQSASRARRTIRHL